MERPILFSTPMVQAIMDERKTQTRRIVKPQGKATCFDVAMLKDGGERWPRNLDADERFLSYMKCPYGGIGDVLWVRETWFDAGHYFIYKADPTDNGFKWRPSIFMPKEACRIKLRITGVRVERLQGISEEDAKAEGCGRAIEWMHDGKIELIEDDHIFYDKASHVTAYKSLWESINSKGSWDKNPWVWVIEFERLIN